MLPLLAAATISAVCATAAINPLPGHPVVIPAVDRNNTFFVTPRTTAGEPLTLFADSGGGGPLIFSDVESRLGVVGTTATLTFSCDRWIPMNGTFLVIPAWMRRGDPMTGASMDGVLGAKWFDGKTWTWDYQQHQLLWRAQSDAPNVAPNHIAALAFQKSGGEHTSGFARIAATIDDRTYSFLLDTGAHTLVTAAAQRMTGLPHQPFATSFISKTIAELWHQRHPDWLYIDDAEAYTHEAIIRVPQVVVGGYSVGPVWFTVRPDKNFSVGMARYMDAPIVGALGGSALSYFRLTVDYRAERAYFERPL